MYVYDANNLPFTGVQDGGLVSACNNTNASQHCPSWETSTNGITSSYTLSGGTFQHVKRHGFYLSRGYARHRPTTLILAGSGL